MTQRQLLGGDRGNSYAPRRQRTGQARPRLSCSFLIPEFVKLVQSTSEQKLSNSGFTMAKEKRAVRTFWRLLARVILLVTCATWPGDRAWAEPWLGSKYAQNCSGCHAPGRKNLKPIDRRCSLSCQGCHVSPNGGGLRSFYGKWTEDRWLRSFAMPELFSDHKSTATVFEQSYKPNVAAAEEKPTKKRRAPKRKRRPTKKGDTAAEQADSELPPAATMDPAEVTKYGHELVTTPDVYPDQRPYDRRDPFYLLTAESEEEFLAQIPQGDPYRQFDYSRTDAGLDARWLWLGLQDHSDKTVRDENKDIRGFLMNVNFSVRFRPFKRYLHLVYENQILGSPAENPLYSKVLDAAATRSLYTMVDNLPYNSFIKVGLYRPLFGQYVPDHNQLSQRMFAWATTGVTRSQAITFQSLSVGTAPNVPFANLHYIGGAKMTGSGQPLDKTNGFAFNGGLRFVSYGGNVNYSYWNTSKENDDGHDTKLQMHGFGIMGTFFDRITQGLDFVTFERDDMPVDKRTGAVITSESYIRYWRENYVTAVYGYANTTSNLLPGEGHQLKVGLRSFLIPGLELSSTIDRDIQNAKTTGPGTSTRSTTWTTQVHFYL
jgi:hypothetical protein